MSFDFRFQAEPQSLSTHSIEAAGRRVAFDGWHRDRHRVGTAKGGQVIFEGTPMQLLTAQESLTAAALRNAIRP